MRNTEYSSRFTLPERAPTIRSVPLMVLAKLARASVRTRSTASNRHTESAMANTVSQAGGIVQLGQRQAAVEQARQALIVADKQQAGTGFAALGKQQFEKGFAGVGIQGRGGFVGDHQLRLADQRTGGGHALLLAD